MPEVTLSSLSVLPQVGTVASGPLVKALFNSYLGADPVSPAAKADFAANLAKAVVA